MVFIKTVPKRFSEDFSKKSQVELLCRLNIPLKNRRLFCCHLIDLSQLKTEVQNIESFHVEIQILRHVEVGAQT